MSARNFDYFGLVVILGVLAVVLLVALAPALVLTFFGAPAWVMPWAWAWDRVVMVVALGVTISLLRV